MKTTLLALGLGVALAACADDGGSGAGSGNDTLPKRGELASDPTIVSATARCSCGGEICSGGDPGNSHVRVRVDGSDPNGASNLGTCAGTLGDVMDQGSYSGSACTLYFKTPSACATGAVHTVGITVSNDTGGVTTASVKLTVAAD
ncbi:MAG: hypothetical protein H0T46_09710 [Deltaproteobacteria bacterium]|nr:hypothetical protein [Deltaproteobacteria bacterium]